MTNVDNSIIGQNVRTIRKSLNLTQEKFAEKLDINPQFLSQIENGYTGISLDNAVNICNVAKCSSVNLFKGIIEASNIVDKYELLNDRDKIIVEQLIDTCLNTD